MATATGLCASVLLLAAATASAYASSGTIEFRGAVVVATGIVPVSGSQTREQAPHRATVETLDKVVRRGEVLEYYVGYMRSRGIDANRLQLITVVYD